MRSRQSHDHHYVPQWYQRRFLAPGETEYFCRDLQAGSYTRGGTTHPFKEVHRWGTKKCFFEEDLYQLKLGGWASDEVERLFFGQVDARGRDAVALVAGYEGDVCREFGDASRDVITYMGAQRFRTPRGLDLIRKRAGSGRNATLQLMMRMFQMYTTVWTECVWEIVRARQSPTKFIVTDAPVTFYNRAMFPSDWVHPEDADYKEIGTRALFPLGPDSCFILTHLQLVRNPWSVPTEFRRNPRSYEHTMKYLLEIQYGRELEEHEVLRINYILKMRATRYVAAAEKEWLFPERRVSTTDWTKLDEDWFLFPNPWKVSFTTGIMAGFNDGSAWAADEYGYHPWQREYQNQKVRQLEHEKFDQSRREWAKKRLGKSRAHVPEFRHDSVHDRMMDEYLRGEGLIADIEGGKGS
jgi:hypothetical protein